MLPVVLLLKDLSLKEVTKMFRKNEGPEDRTIRIVVGIVFLAVGASVVVGWGILGLVAFSGSTATIVGVVLAVLGAIGLVTGATGRCPTYVLLGGISTLHEPQGRGARAYGTPVGSH